MLRGILNRVKAKKSKRKIKRKVPGTGFSFFLNYLTVKKPSFKQWVMKPFSFKRTFSIPKPSMENISLQARMVIVFAVIILLITAGMGTVIFEEAKTSIASVMTSRIKITATDNADKISIMLHSMDKREIASKTDYYLTKQRNAYKVLNYRAYVDVVDDQGKTVVPVKQEQPLQPKESDLAALLKKGKNGESQSALLGGVQCTVVMEPIPGRPWYFVAGVAEEDYLAPVSHMRMMALGVGLGALVLATILCIYGTRKFCLPLQQMIKMMERARTGDLTVRAVERGVGPEFNQLGVAFNAMLKELAYLLNELNQTTQVLLKSSREMSQVADQQLDAVKKTGQAVGMMSSSVQQITAMAGVTQESGSSMMKAAGEGTGSVKKLVEVINQNHEVIAEEARAVGNLGTRVQEISRLVDLIRKISKDTHLLALNASIEAARAGEQGRGFAVVAAEVGRLAEDTASTTKEVEQIIAAIAKESSLVLEKVEQSKSIAEEGISATLRAEDALQHIVDTIHSTWQQISNIYQGAEQISLGTATVEELIQDLAGDPYRQEEQHSATAHQIASTARTLDELSGALRSRLAGFKLASLNPVETMEKESLADCTVYGEEGKQSNETIQVA